MTTPAIASPLLAATAAPAADPAAAGGREQLVGAAKQFEAIFLRQMLSTARAANFGETIFSGSPAMGTFRQMRDERFADIAADTGAFGLARMIEAHLARFVPEDGAPPAEAGAAAKQEGAADGL